MTDQTGNTLPTDLSVDPAEALALAARVLEEVTPRFVEGLGAEGTRVKGSRNDFATELDLELERRISDALREGTGLEVHGEEYGGPPVNEGTLWVVDPIDGTANYSLGIPTTGILVSLVHERQPVLGLTWLPLLGMRFTSIAGGPLKENDEEIPRIADVSIRDVALGLGSLNTGARTTYPPAYRREVFEQLTLDAARTRKFGSTGVDLSFVGSSRLSAAVSFGNYAWDNAAGASHIRAAGGVVTDLAGEPWSIDSQSILAAGPRAHAEVLGTIRELGEPGNFFEAGRRRATPGPDGNRPWLDGER
ncbi:MULTISPECIES: inositol monophosphatase [unclassified Dietzia]|uniref:inositol monophosphatase family protein n=1 Tax=unclassified Dietzia TaxID=2617939 RepID=UPI000D22835E|nr:MULTISPECIES: inositol monophosphatase [unclassified Dietzia]AVZ39234.1 inositol monophosphatase [Dietzia sp. JS16-p6b]MBB1024603.1 inositol monophosphatase [Dietzia sp. DQ12-76]MBB1026674.1 inositol monophosphatase [Dietzia sp. DQ11-38-2]QGW24467.1 putative inositol monophosphatase ImpA [Dietzia sp. DQ12-45-1b]